MVGNRGLRRVTGMHLPGGTMRRQARRMTWTTSPKRCRNAAARGPRRHNSEAAFTRPPTAKPHIREESMMTHVDVDVQQLWRDYRAEPTTELRNQLVEL